MVLGGENRGDDRRKKREMSGERKADPQRQVAYIKRIPDTGERTGRHQRSEPVAAPPGDDADVSHGPQPHRFAERNERRARSVQKQ